MIVEPILCLSLDDYFHKNIFAPLDMDDINFFSSSEMKSHLAHAHQKTQDAIRTYHYFLDSLSSPQRRSGHRYSTAEEQVVSPHRPSTPVSHAPKSISSIPNPHTGRSSRHPPEAYIVSSSSTTESFANQIEHLSDFACV